jgi:hypothetical protein
MFLEVLNSFISLSKKLLSTSRNMILSTEALFEGRNAKSRKESFKGFTKAAFRGALLGGVGCYIGSNGDPSITFTGAMLFSYLEFAFYGSRSLGLAIMKKLNQKDYESHLQKFYTHDLKRKNRTDMIEEYYRKKQNQQEDKLK